MKQIESETDLMQWAASVNHSVKMCDLQDVYARSDVKLLKKWFNESSQNDRELLVFSIQKCMGSACLLDLVRCYARFQANMLIEQEQEEINAQWSTVLTEKNAIAQREIELSSTIESLTADVNHLNDVLETTRDDKNHLYQRNMELIDENTELTLSLEKLQVFESHIKELLNT